MTGDAGVAGIGAELRVVATAGHVDHGKSSLIVALTGIDPDRWDEEKRRGLTIDLGYAWCALPSGREIGFVDVPGARAIHHQHARGGRAGPIGPVRRRRRRGVETTIRGAPADPGCPRCSRCRRGAHQDRPAGRPATSPLRPNASATISSGTTLADAPIVPVASTTGAGVDDIRSALDRMLDAVPTPEPTRTRLFVDRVFTIKGSGTVVTGTLVRWSASGSATMSRWPLGTVRARIRSLQTHERSEDRAFPVSRVAANLAGIERDEASRGRRADPARHVGTDRRDRRGRASRARARPCRGFAGGLQGVCRRSRGRRSAEVPGADRCIGAWRRQPSPASGSADRWCSTCSIGS